LQRTFRGTAGMGAGHDSGRSEPPGRPSRHHPRCSAASRFGRDRPPHSHTDQLASGRADDSRSRELAHPTGFEPVTSAFGGNDLQPKTAENRHSGLAELENKSGSNGEQTSSAPE